MKIVLLITEQFDPTADLLIAELRRRDVPCVRWNLDQFPLGSSLTYRASKQLFDTEIITDGRRVDLNDIGSVWCRRFSPGGFNVDIGPKEKQFAELEARTVLTALMKVAKCIWINHPERERVANSKPIQLSVARKVGSDIPRTVITNDPDEVRAFIGNSDARIVYKALSQPLNIE